ncbi:MAG: hypothetical protein E7523_13140 [Ruminococcaceae bacterium]|nr:hypothetical protein [Oscillospiraceae bacterium]
MTQTECIPPKTERSIIARYVREVNKELIATPKQKRKLFGDLKSDIHDRIADGKIAGYEDIVAHFGTPVQVAKDFFATADVKEIKKKLMIRRIIISAVLFCVLLWVGVVAYLKYDIQAGSHNYTVESFEVDGEILYEDVLVDDNRIDQEASLPHFEKENQ